MPNSDSPYDSKCELPLYFLHEEPFWKQTTRGTIEPLSALKKHAFSNGLSAEVRTRLEARLIITESALHVFEYDMGRHSYYKWASVPIDALRGFFTEGERCLIPACLVLNGLPIVGIGINKSTIPYLESLERLLSTRTRNGALLGVNAYLVSSKGGDNHHRAFIMNGEELAVLDPAGSSPERPFYTSEKNHGYGGFWDEQRLFLFPEKGPAYLCYQFFSPSAVPYLKNILPVESFDSIPRKSTAFALCEVSPGVFLPSRIDIDDTRLTSASEGQSPVAGEIKDVAGIEWLSKQGVLSLQINQVQGSKIVIFSNYEAMVLISRSVLISHGSERFRPEDWPRLFEQRMKYRRNLILSLLLEDIYRIHKACLSINGLSGDGIMQPLPLTRLEERVFILAHMFESFRMSLITKRITFPSTMMKINAEWDREVGKDLRSRVGGPLYNRYRQLYDSYISGIYPLVTELRALVGKLDILVNPNLYQGQGKRSLVSAGVSSVGFAVLGSAMAPAILLAPIVNYWLANKEKKQFNSDVMSNYGESFITLWNGLVMELLPAQIPEWNEKIWEIESLLFQTDTKTHRPPRDDASLLESILGQNADLWNYLHAPFLDDQTLRRDTIAEDFLAQSKNVRLSLL
jgi:hypothetical protein